MAIQNPFLGLLAQAQAQQRQQRFAREQANRQFGQSLMAALGGEIFKQAGTGIYEATSPVVEARLKKAKALTDSIALENEQRRRAAKVAEGATDIGFKEAVGVPMTQGEGRGILDAVGRARAVVDQYEQGTGAPALRMSKAKTSEDIAPGDTYEQKYLQTTGMLPGDADTRPSAEAHKLAKQTLAKYPALTRKAMTPPGDIPEGDDFERKLQQQEDAHREKLIKGLEKIPEKYKNYTSEQKAAYMKARTTRRDTERSALLTALQVARHQGQYIDTDVDSEHWSDYIIGKTLDKNKDLTQIQTDALKAKLKARRSGRYKGTSNLVDRFVKQLPRGIGKQARQRFALTLHDNQSAIEIGGKNYSLAQAWKNKQLRQAVLAGHAKGVNKGYAGVSLTHDNPVVRDKMLNSDKVYARSAKIAEMKEDARAAAEIRKDRRGKERVDQAQLNTIQNTAFREKVKGISNDPYLTDDQKTEKIDNLLSLQKATINQLEFDTPSRPAPQKSSLGSRLSEAAYRLFGVPLGSDIAPDIQKKMMAVPGLGLWAQRNDPSELTDEAKAALGLR